MNYINRLVFFLSTILLFNNANAQRIIDTSIYTPAYYDSVRAAVNDTTIEHYIIQAYRLAENENIKIDGILDENAWSIARHQSGFLEKDPYPLAKMSDDTEFAVLYDENNIYFGVWSWESEPEKIVRQLNPRGAASPDNINIFLDPYHDHRTGYKFNISPTGVQSDELRYDDFKRDINWNGVWYSASYIDNKGWYAEVKIPFFNLRFRDMEEHVFGLNIMRNISKNGSRGQWKPHLWEWDLNTRMSKNGQIEGIRGIKAGRSFELRPYALSGLTQVAPDSPYKEINVGLDIRYSPSNNVTADVTVNPDFAQVDADVTQINLTRFPTRFKELRPFFTERTNIFNTPLELFYSRRIGARGDILGGAKVTGKTQNGFEFGSLVAFTGESVFSQSSNHQVGEKAGFGVFRLKKEVFNSSSIGMLAADKEDESKYNRIIGIDGTFVINTQYLLDIQTAISKTESINTNNLAVYSLLQRTGDEFGATANVSYIQPFFEINRIGYLRKERNRGMRDMQTTWRYTPRINKHKLQRVGLNLELGRSTDLFTDNYINSWLEDNPGVKHNNAFGTIDGAHTISSGIREFDNWNHTENLFVTFENNAELAAEYSQFKQTEVTGSYTGDTWKFGFKSRPLTKGARFPYTITYETGTFYNFDKKYVGNLKNLLFTIQGRINQSILSSLETEKSNTYNPMAKNDGEYYRFSSYTTLMFTKDFYVRLQLQGNFGTTFYDEKKVNNKYLISGLLSWQYQPGSFFFIAYNEGRYDEDSPFHSKYFYFSDRTLLLKWSYRFNI